MNRKSKVLLTANYGPNDNLAWGEDMYDLFKSRLARGHGPFSMTNHMHYLGLYLIAENISNPATVLENPHWDEFDRELDEGYDVVGFQLKSLHTPKIAKMMRLVREKCPKTKIVVGGYGVSALDTPPPADTAGDGAYIRENADYLCREEGVRFMRRILGDEPVEREITQYHMPMCGVTIDGVSGGNARAPNILVSLGCPNACDFCNTSAFFHHKKIYVASPEQVFRFMKHHQKRLGRKQIIVMLMDEDFFLNADYVRELGRMLRSDRDMWDVRWGSFGSAKSLSQFTAKELRDCGCGFVWIGVESFISDDGATEDMYAKRRGEEIEKLFRDLQSHNIQITGSLVLGFDFHTPENLKEDIDRFVALKPFFYQIAPLTPCPGTALYDRMMEEGRLADDYKWEHVHIWHHDLFDVKNFKKGEIKKFYDYAHEKISDELGPPPMQLMESALDSCQTFKRYTDEFGKHQAMQAKRAASGVVAYMRAVIENHHSEIVRERARKMERRYRDEIGEIPVVSRLASRYLARAIHKNAQRQRPPVVSDPPPRWTYYNTFDDRVWVKKGREAKKPVPYQDRNGMVSVARFVRG